MQERETIRNVGKKFGLTAEQSEELWFQYWMEWVIRSLYDMEEFAIGVVGLGTFFARKISLERLISKQPEYDDPKLKESFKKERQRYLDLIEEIDKYNSRYKRTRLYG